LWYLEQSGLSRLHALLGRLPDIPVPVFGNPEALRLAERFDRLPDAFQAAALEQFASVERLAAILDGPDEKG